MSEQNVFHPSHYKKGGIECFDVIDEMVIGYSAKEAVAIGNVVKYLYRAPFKKNKVEDIDKAVMYLLRLQDKVHKEMAEPSDKVMDAWDRKHTQEAVIKGRLVVRRNK